MREKRQQVLLHGFIAGVLGYLAVVLFFALLSVAGGRSPLEIPSAMGAALLPQGRLEGVGVDIGSALAFNGIHLILSLAVGVVVAWLLYEAETRHQLWYVVTLVLIGGFIFGLLAMGVVGSELAHAVTWNAVLFGNILWAAAMAGYLYRFHRGLMADVEGDPVSSTG